MFTIRPTVSTLRETHASLSSPSIPTKRLLACYLWSSVTKQSNKAEHEEGDHNPDSREIRQVPGQGHEGGSSGQRSGVRDAGRRRQEPAAGDRRRRGLEQATEEAQEEGGRGGDRGAADARHVRGGGAPAPGDQEGAGGDDGDGGGAVALQQQPPPAPAVAAQLRRGAHKSVLLPLLPVAGGRWLRLRLWLWLRGRRRRGQQLLAGGGAQPSGQLLADGGKARLPAHGPLLFLLGKAEADYGGAAPWQRHQQLHHTLVPVCQVDAVAAAA